MSNSPIEPSSLVISPSRRKFTSSALIAVAALYWFSLYVFVPTLPVYVQSKVQVLSLVGFVLSMYGLWQLIIRLPYGVAADWVGLRKPFILFGLLLVGSGAWILSSAQDINGLAFGRALTGLGSGTWVALVVMYSALYPPSEAIRATGLMTTICTLGRLSAMSLTGSLNNLGGYALAFQVSIAASMLAFIITLFIPEQRLPAQPPSLKGLAKLFLRRDVLLPSALSAVLHFGDWIASFSYFPILARRFEADNLTLSALAALNLGLVLLGNLAVARLGHRFDYRRLALVTFLLSASGLAIAAVAPSLPVVFLAQAFIGAAYGVGYPTLMGASIRYVEEKERTSAMGLHQALYAAGMFGGPWIGGMLLNWMDIQPMFAISAVAIVIAGVAGVRALQPPPQP